MSNLQFTVEMMLHQNRQETWCYGSFRNIYNVIPLQLLGPEFTRFGFHIPEMEAFSGFHTCELANRNRLIR